MLEIGPKGHATSADIQDPYNTNVAQRKADSLQKKAFIWPACGVVDVHFT